MKKFIALTAAATFAMGVTGAFAESHSAGDVEAGATVFKKCAACHNVEEAKNKIGPHLVNVIGRTPGSLEDFKYSKGMTTYGEENVWDEATLTDYLANPRGVVKGTRMAFAGLKKEEDLVNVIAYLKTFSEEMEKAE